MAWLTLTDLSDRFGADAMAEVQAGGADASVAVNDACAECEGYLARAITLPIVTPGAALLRLACDVARYNLWRRDLPADHAVVVAYRQALGDLADVAAGRLTLQGVVGSTSTAAPAAGWAVKTSARVFTDARLGLMDDSRLLPGTTFGGAA
jgi:phage gp36-like protein